MDKKASLLETIAQYVNTQEHFPILHPDAAKIQGEIVKPDPDMSAVKKLIKTDPTLTSEILKTANSSYYRGLGEIFTIKEAALRLGQDQLSAIIMRAILKQTFSVSHPMIKKMQGRLWDHSVASAFASLWIARHLKMEELAQRAYIAGLLHDMGKLGLLSALDQMITKENNAEHITKSIVDKILDTLHCKQGYALLSRWNIPDHYCRIARDHHLEEIDTADSLLAIVRLANMVCAKMERKDPDEDLTLIMGSKEADSLGINETGIALLEIAMEDARLLE